jgi:Spy/CpxP family protein refolding chaperone
MLPVLCLAASLTAVAVYAATTTPAAGTPPAFAGGHYGHRHHHGFMGFVLHKLGLTDGQKTQIKGIFAGEKSQYEALHASVKTNRQALETTAPTSPDYPALVQQAQTNAAQRIKLESETWSAIYSSVLSKPQRDAIPGVVAAANAQHEARMAAWKAQHPQPSVPATED